MVKGSVDTYTVPAGKRAIVRCVTGANLSPSQADIALSINTYLVLYFFMAIGQSAERTGLHIVLNAGEVLKLAVGHSAVTGQVSGHLLDA